MKPSFLAVGLAARWCLLSTVALCAAAPPLREDNVPVQNVTTAYNNLKHHGEPLAFRPAGGPAVLGGVPTDSHYQGIVRAAGPGEPHLFVSSAVKSGDKKANLISVRLASRDNDGERLRSNRLQKDSGGRDTMPPPEDRVVSYRPFDWKHAGGMQACGDILAVPLEDPNFTTSLQSRIAFFDVRDPARPVELSTSITSTSHACGVVGLIRLPDGHFLVAATWGDNKSVEFHRSTHTSFQDAQLGWTLVYTWTPSELKGGYDWPTGKTSHQMLNFVRQEDGRLFLLGARNTSAGTPILIGKDELFLYEVTGWEAGSNKIVLTQSQEARHLYSHNAETGFADFLAGVGVYVSPTGELIVYASEHYNWGPGFTVRFMEFRNRDVFNETSFAYLTLADAGTHEYFVEEGSELNLNASRSRGPIVKPWIELYDDDDFEGESLVMDYADQGKDDFQDLRKMNFNDRASSVRWWMPSGWTIKLFDDDNFKTAGGVLTLNGGFGVQTIANLSDPPWRFDNGDLININETRVTSLAIIPPSDANNYLLKPLTYSWRAVDGPVDAIKMEETGVMPRLMARNGPADVTVLLTVAGAGRAEDTVLVHVLNVAPNLQSVRINQPSVADGRVSLRVRFTDPGQWDTHMLHVVWGDGTESDVPIARNQRVVNADHQFPVGGDGLRLFTGSLRLRDSDGAEAVAPLQFRPGTPLSSTVDTDGDGLPDGWEFANFGTLQYNGSIDNDGDGVPDAAEYAMGSDPTTPDAHPLSLVRDGRGVRLSFIAARGPVDGLGQRKRYFSLMRSANLRDWTPVPSAQDIVGADQQQTVRVPARLTSEFFRLDAEVR